MTEFDDLDDLETSSGNGHAYWAQRHGQRGGRIPLETACRLFRSFIAGLVEQGYFQEWFGYYCVDAEDVPGLAWKDPAAFAFRKTRLEGIWPVGELSLSWDELHLLTAVEFLYEHVSKPKTGRFHNWNNCGWHYSKFNRAAGRALYLHDVNEILRDLDDGFELQPNAEVVRTVPTGLEDLVGTPLPETATSLERRTLEHAVIKFRARGSSELDQLDALRNLAALLESIRPQLKDVFEHQDEADLFQITNRFNIRHSRADQQSKYDRAIFLPWLFYSHVAAIHAAIGLIERAMESG
jgi:hypothetical protein